MRKMYYLMLMLLISAASMNAQVTIGSQSDPHDGAVLDLSKVAGKNKGFLLPQAELTSVTSWTPVGGEKAEGMMVYNSGSALAKGVYVWTVNAEYANGFWAKVSVPSVIVTGVSLNQTTTKVAKNQTKTFVATVTPSNATNKAVTWSSSDENVATVSDGVVTAIEIGTARITVTTVDGNFKAFCDVDILAADAWIMADQGSPNTITDARDGQVYRTRNFGSAGTWLVENLRYIPNQANASTEGSWSYVEDNNIPYYNYFGAYSTTETTKETAKAKSYDSHPEYGVFYNWSAATKNAFGSSINPADNTNSTINAGTVTSSTQGICPAGWVLPSDKDWSDLEKEIANNPSAYSTNSGTSWDEAWRSTKDARPSTGASIGHGKSMKSPIKVPGASQETNGASNTDGSGFNALLVGNSFSAGQNALGLWVYYWSSTSYNTTKSMTRSVYHNIVSVGRNESPRNMKASVRCKKAE